MKIGVTAAMEHSMFSSGTTNASLAVAELMRELGHEVTLIHMGPNQVSWWDDCRPLATHWTVKRLMDVEPGQLDILFEIGALMVGDEQRRRVMGEAGRCIWVVRHAFLLDEIEATIFPTIRTAKRELEGLHETWIFDAAAATEKGSVQALELLTRRPVRVVPYVWSPSPVVSTSKEVNLPPWIATTVGELVKMQKHGVETGLQDQPLPPWKVHIAETNTGNSSSATLPLVILREAKRRGVPIADFRVHNSGWVKQSRFFRENVVKHCTTGGGVDLSGEFVERQICVGWACQPMSCVVSHIRFAFLRPMLLDVAWLGIPIVHNSVALREVGHGLERLFYSDNHVGAACDAMMNMTNDLMTVKGIFSPDALPAIQQELLARWSPLSKKVQEGWRVALGATTGAGGIPVAVAAAPAVAAPAAPAVAAPAAPAVAAPAVPGAPSPVAPIVADKRRLSLGFCDMWDQFNPSYNFFTLALADAGRRMTPPVEVTAGPASPTDDVVIFGPFGDAWRSLPADQPKVHFTGENTAPVEGPGVVLNLGFHHYDMTRENYLRFPLWLLEIDWFGADAARIANPKPIPLATCTTVDTSEEAIQRHRSKFCAFVVSNPSNPVRNAAFHWLSAYKQVDSAGRLFNNVGAAIFAGAGGGGGEQAKVEFFRDYKFALTYENSSARGYTTEKYLHAKAAGCVPIYWGDPAFERDFDVAGCIDARDARTPEELVELVRRVDEDEGEWLRRYSVPALDSYKVAWAQRTMAELCRRLMSFGGVDVDTAPRIIGDEPPAAAAPAPVAPAPAPATGTLELPVLATYANRRFLSSLQQWLGAAAAQRNAVPQLEAIVYVDPDIPAETRAAIEEKFSWAQFRTLPSAAGAPPDTFPDFWAPQHYGWKLWLLRELCGEAALAGRMVLYMDAGTFLCRWPQAWLRAAQAAGICLLEDPREENGRWCSDALCAALGVTDAEKGGQQVQAATIAFRAGGAAASALFQEAYRWAGQRDVLVGEKWVCFGPDGKPRGHRHDQAILSILSRRQGIARFPLDEVQCGESLRETFGSGRAIYIHRGYFQMHKLFATGIDEAYVINLDRRADRMERLWANHPGLQGRVKRWSAVEGKALRLTPALEKLLRPNDFFWKKAVTGCALSHLGLWWKLATDHPDIQSYLILEDDVKINPAWEAAWQHAHAEGHVPDDYDILYLGGVLPPNRAGWAAVGRERVNESFVRVAENTMWGQSAPTRYFHFCAYAYILSRQGVQKVIDLIEGHGGIWTSADHVLCNPVNVLKAYVFDPVEGGMPAGCYQDDDPNYAAAEFNNFSRIDSFDSDLWNNDERFSEEERAAATAEGGDAEVDIGAALADARKVGVDVSVSIGGKTPTWRAIAVPAARTPDTAAEELKRELKVEAAAAAAAPAPALHAPPVQPAASETRPVRLLPRRVLCMRDDSVDMSKFYEYEWVKYLFGNPSILTVESIRPTAPPPSDEPILLVQRPYDTDVLASMLERWSTFGANFYIFHMSDEAVAQEYREPLEWYDVSGCKGVLRFYPRDDLSGCKTPVYTIPLGYHWTLQGGSQNPLMKTPRLPFRETTWSFFGTGWQNRKALLHPLLVAKDLGQSRVKFFDQWKDPGALGKEEYIATLLDSVFVACPGGMNPETFRLYEALECGCVPLVVRTPSNTQWLDWITKKIPLIAVPSWEAQVQFVRHLMANKQLLEAYRENMLHAWIRWREELKRDVGVWLDGGQLPTSG